MADKVFPTKGNLINLKNSYALAKTGYELMDRKRNVLIREVMQLLNEASEIKDSINKTYITAYEALKKANIKGGIPDDIALSAPVENGVNITYRSVMGVNLPKLSLTETDEKTNPFTYHRTNIEFDEAVKAFTEVKKLCVKLAEIESSIYRLSVNIKKTQKRANALKNIVIPKFTEQIAFITDVLNEREREEFSRLKVIKKKKD